MEKKFLQIRSNFLYEKLFLTPGYIRQNISHNKFVFRMQYRNIHKYETHSQYLRLSFCLNQSNNSI